MYIFIGSKSQTIMTKSTARMIWWISLKSILINLRRTSTKTPYNRRIRTNTTTMAKRRTMEQVSTRIHLSKTIASLSFLFIVRSPKSNHMITTVQSQRQTNTKMIYMITSLLLTTIKSQLLTQISMIYWVSRLL